MGTQIHSDFGRGSKLNNELAFAYKTVNTCGFHTL